MTKLSEAERQQIIDLALAADRLRQEPAFQQAVLALRKEAIEALVTVDPTDTEAVRTHQSVVKAIDGLCGQIAGMILRATPTNGPTVA